MRKSLKTESKIGRFISASQLSAWEACPEKWRFGWGEGARQKPENRAQTIGKVIHEAIDRLVKKGSPVVTPSGICAEIDGLDIEEDIRTGSKSLATSFCDVPLDGALGSEVEFSIQLNTKTRMVGYIDFIALDPQSGVITVTDWKSGPSPTGLAGGDMPEAQLRIYSAAAKTLYPAAKEVRARILYLGNGRSFDYELSPEKHKKTLSDVRAAGRLMRSGKIEAKPGAQCQQCDHNSECQAYGEWRASGGGEFKPTYQEVRYSAPSEPVPLKDLTISSSGEWMDSSCPNPAWIVTRTAHFAEECLDRPVGSSVPSNMPVTGESVHMISDGSLTFLAALEWILAIRNRIERLNISNWSVSEEACNRVIDLYDQGRIGSLNVSFARYSCTRDAEFYGRFQKMLRERNQGFRIWRNHSKVLVADSLSILSSATFTDHRRYDQYTIIDDVRLADFNREWMEHAKKRHEGSTTIPRPSSSDYVPQQGGIEAKFEMRSAQFRSWLDIDLAHDETVHVIADGRFDFFSAFRWALSKFDDQPDIHLCSWWWSREAFSKVIALFDAGRIKSLTVVFCLTYTRRCEDVYLWMVGELDKRRKARTQHRLWINHAKVCSMISASDAYCIETSANFSQNQNMEQIDITRSRAAAELHRDWMSRRDGLSNQQKGKEPKKVISVMPTRQAGAIPVGVMIGRFQPMHRGHADSIRAIKTPLIFVVEGEKSSRDKVRNPLSSQRRSELIRSEFPDALIRVTRTGSIREVFAACRREGFEPTSIHCGSDRIASYRETVRRINNQARKAEARKFQIEWVENPRDGVSATIVRDAIRRGDREEFERLTPESIHAQFVQLREEMDG